MRASRQTELQRSQPIHVVCSWLGNSPRVAQRSYLLTTNSDFEKAIQGGIADVGANRQEPEVDEAKHRGNIKNLGESITLKADGEGFEDLSVLQGKLDISSEAARKAARLPIEVLLLELWQSATDSARLQALEILQQNSTSQDSQHG